MIRHATAEDLASLDLDGLRARKAARVRNHVATCVRCTQLSSQVSAVPTVLASVSYPSMPSNLTSQLDATLASESSRRLANAPATEADRRDLPERRSRRSHGGWQLPGMSNLGTRLVAAAGALVLVGVGGYEFATHTGGSVNTTSADSSGSASVPSARQVSLGPSVQFGQASGTKTIRTVYSAENFTAADLGVQALAAVRGGEVRRRVRRTTRSRLRAYGERWRAEQSLRAQSAGQPDQPHELPRRDCRQPVRAACGDREVRRPACHDHCHGRDLDQSGSSVGRRPSVLRVASRYDRSPDTERHLALVLPGRESPRPAGG